jgi:hypothetical protein
MRERVRVAAATGLRSGRRNTGLTTRRRTPRRRRSSSVRGAHYVAPVLVIADHREPVSRRLAGPAGVLTAREVVLADASHRRRAR